jgi:ABC-type bacteriocin/lantibiotic exporter with double-glycine peptidase domain
MQKSVISKLLALLHQERDEINAIYFYAILSGLIQLSVPLGIQSIIGFVMGAQMVASIYVLIFLVVLGVLLVGVCQINQMKIIEKIQQRIYTRYAFRFSEVIPQFDILKSDSVYLPEHVNKFFDVLNVQKGISKILLDIPLASIQIILGIVLLALYHPIFIMFGLMFLAILILILKYTSHKGIETSMVESKYKYETVSWLQDMARIIKSIKFSQGSNLNLSKTDKNVLGYLKARTEHFGVLLIQYRTLVVFKVIISLAMLGIGTYLLVNQLLNIGEFIAAEIVILMLIGATEKLISNIENIYDVVTGLEKLHSVLDTPLEKEGSIDLQENLEQGLKIDLVKFGMKYDFHDNLFEDTNLSIPNNKLIGVSGKEGFGKTSLLKLLSAGYTQYSGTILINNVPLVSYNLESFRKKVGIYIYPMEIFKGTLYENISMNRDCIDELSILNLIKEIGFDDFLIQFSEGFDTKIDASGKKLATNITKKILLLRALANNPKLILLDEPFAGLSDFAKEKLLHYLNKIKSNTTILIATNDKSMLKNCDEQIFISNQKIEFK